MYRPYIPASSSVYSSSRSSSYIPRRYEGRAPYYVKDADRPAKEVVEHVNPTGSKPSMVYKPLVQTTEFGEAVKGVENKEELIFSAGVDSKSPPPVDHKHQFEAPPPPPPPQAKPKIKGVKRPKPIPIDESKQRKLDNVVKPTRVLAGTAGDVMAERMKRQKLEEKRIQDEKQAIDKSRADYQKTVYRVGDTDILVGQRCSCRRLTTAIVEKTNDGKVTEICKTCRRLIGTYKHPVRQFMIDAIGYSQARICERMREDLGMIAAMFQWCLVDATCTTEYKLDSRIFGQMKLNVMGHPSPDRESIAVLFQH